MYTKVGLNVLPEFMVDSLVASGEIEIYRFTVNEGEITLPPV